MKKYILIGVITLVMLLAIPGAMAANPPLVASGSITQTLTLDNSASTYSFGEFTVGDNQHNDVGTLTVTAQWTAWKVTASTGPFANDGWMYNNNGGGPGYLQNPLSQWNYNTATWSNVKDFTFSGPKTSASSVTTMSESFKQPVVDADVPGTYAVTITYTVAAV